MSDYLTLCQQLRREVGAAGEGPTDVVAQEGEYQRLVHWVNQSNLYIQGLWEDWKFLWSPHQFLTVIGQREYPLTAMAPLDTTATSLAGHLGRFDRNSFVYQPSTDNWVNLDYVEWEDFKRNQLLGATIPQAQPHTVAQRPDGTLLLYPTPDVIAPIYCELWRNPLALAQSTDISLVPEAFHRTIVVMAKLYYAEYEDAPEVYTAANTELAAWINRLESDQLPSKAFYRNRASLNDLEMVVRPH